MELLSVALVGCTGRACRFFPAVGCTAQEHLEGPILALESLSRKHIQKDIEGSQLEFRLSQF